MTSNRPNANHPWLSGFQRGNENLVAKLEATARQRRSNDEALANLLMRAATEIRRLRRDEKNDPAESTD